MPAQIAASAREKHLAHIVENAEEGIVSVDSEQRIIIFNRGAEEIFGYAASDVLGRRLGILLPKRYRAGHRAHLAAFGSFDRRPPRMAERSEVFGRRKNGEEFPIEASIMRSDLGDEAVFTAIIRDGTERKRAELALRAAIEQAERASNAKSTFLANMSHELRTPLNTVIGFAEMMEMQTFGPLGDAYLSYARNIHESGQHLLDIINDILDIAKIEAGQQQVHDADVSMPAVVAAMLRLVRARAEKAGLGFAVELPPDLPLLRADERLIKQILLNLLSNAIKFTPTGGRIMIKAAYCTDGRLALTVADTGVGMDPAKVPLALQPFVQIDSSLCRKSPGAGLGLSLVRSFAELHGANLSIESAIGTGTTVTIRFPTSRVRGPDKSAGAPLRDLQPASSAPARDASPSAHDIRDDHFDSANGEDDE
jgi:PAS domain S-box-containing protein